MKFSPALRPQVLRLIDELDDGACPIAEVWREAGHRARQRKLLQPSYESVRRLVHEQRERRRLEYSRLKRAGILTAEFLWRTRDPKQVMLDVLTGDDLDRRLHEYQRKPRDKSSRAKPRGDA